MIKYIKFVIFLPVILLVVGNVFGQNAKKQIPTDIAEPFNTKNYKNWRKEDAGNYSLYLPNELKIKVERGIDTSSLVGENGQIKIYIYRGGHPPNSPSRTADFVSFEEKYMFINQIFSWQWKYENDQNEYKYSKEAVFFNDADYKGYNAFISFACKDEKNLEIADKIFNSVIFKVIPKIEERRKPDKFEISPSKSSKTNQ